MRMPEKETEFANYPNISLRKLNVTNLAEINKVVNEVIAEVVYEAATDGKDQIKYFAGEDAKAYYNRKVEIGDKPFRDEIDGVFFG